MESHKVTIFTPDLPVASQLGRVRSGPALAAANELTCAGRRCHPELCCVIAFTSLIKLVDQSGEVNVNTPLGEITGVVAPCLAEASLLPPPPSLSHLALGLSVGTSALIAALLLAVSGVMISTYPHAWQGRGNLLHQDTDISIFD